jgi:predicted MFS family arabinose efflux permease
MKTAASKFSGYQIFIVVLLAVLQFTIILDFMVLSPLGAILIDEMDITTSQFSMVVSAYAISAFFSGMLAAGFADKFDRKKLLIFFYIGFIVGTLFCGLSYSFVSLLLARIVTGLFGGVIGSIGFAIITDLFGMDQRGRVMGFVQMAFSASQILGIPLGLFLAEKFNWHVPFFGIVGFSIIVVLAVLFYMKPITAHIAANKHRNAFTHLWKTMTNSRYARGFLATALLATGGFMMMPFGSTFAANNLCISIEDLPFLYAVTGLFTIVIGPVIGRFSDKIGKYFMFMLGTIVTIIFVAVFTNLGPTPFWLVIVLNVVLFVGITGRMIPSSALLTAVPSMQDRGAFMSINSSIQQLAGGLAAILAGTIVYQNDRTGELENYPLMGLVVIFFMILAAYFMWLLNNMVKRTPPDPGFEASRVSTEMQEGMSEL